MKEYLVWIFKEDHFITPKENFNRKNIIDRFLILNIFGKSSFNDSVTNVNE